MFQSIRPNSQLYIFHKGENPRLEVGQVINTPITKPKYQVPPTFGQPQEMVVDLSVKINGQTFNYSGIPANLDIADSFSNGENIVISDSREAMNAEILSIKQKSVDAINSVDFHRNMISKCDSILSDLNPEFAEKQAQRVEIEELKTQVSDMATLLKELKEANSLFIETLNKKEKFNG